jgi:dynein heavy chain, axonemal
MDILVHASSNYIVPFQDLSKQLVARAAEANDNLKFLESIRVQCTALREIESETLVTILPDLLNRIRLIWLYSTFYNSEDRICGLLRKVSNEIIQRFRKHVPVRQVFDGDVGFCIARLQEAIHCGIEWKVMYHETVVSINRQKGKYGGRCWNMDDASIFAQVDAFVQRCRDLIEVCESQMQFVRKSSETVDQPGPLPVFGGTKAQEIADAIYGIQGSFEHLVDRLRRLDYDILDVRISKWHDDYHHFKNAVKDLEVMYTNIIVLAYDNNSTVPDGVVLIETFHHLAKRDAVKRCVERKASGSAVAIL